MHGARYRKPKRLKPAGHSATIEALIQPAIVIASTLMSAIAAYVLAYDEIARLLANRGTWQDAFVVILCVGMGFLIDMAIIVSATRYKMHAVRADPREARWLNLARLVLTIGLVSETMTLFYFFVQLDTAAYPWWLVWLAGMVHAFLVSARAFLPPVVVAYFAAGVLPIAFDRADRNREIKTRTSTNVMTLIDRLSYVEDTEDKGEMLRALGGQLVLDTYATYDETARTTEDEQLARDGKLLAHMARMHGLDWSQLGADVAPELVHAPTPQPLPLVQPQTPPPAAQSSTRLSNHDLRRAVLAKQMDTHLEEYDLPDDDPADDSGDWGRYAPPADDRAWDEQSFVRIGGHPTSPRANQRASFSNHTGRKNGSSAARISPRYSDMAVDLPTGKSARKGDNEESKRVMNYLDRNPGAKLKEVAAKAKVSLPTARIHYRAWVERNRRLGDDSANYTEEMPAVLPDRQEQSEKLTESV